MSLNKNIILDLKKKPVFSVLFAVDNRLEGDAHNTHTRARPWISIFAGTFIDKLHYPAPYPNPTHDNQPQSNSHPNLKTMS